MVHSSRSVTICKGCLSCIGMSNSTTSCNVTVDEIKETFNFPTFRYVLITFVAVVALCGVIGNTLVAMVSASQIDTTRPTERYFLLVLAGTDTIGCIFHGLFHILRYVAFENSNLTVWCYFKFMVYFTVGASAMIMLFTAIHRYQTICNPFERNPTLTWRRICLALSLGISFVYSLLKGVRKLSYAISNRCQNGTISMTRKHYCVSVYFDNATDRLLEGVGLLVIILLSIITVGLYIPVIHHTRQIFNKRRTTLKLNRNRSESNLEQRDTGKQKYTGLITKWKERERDQSSNIRSSKERHRNNDARARKEKKTLIILNRLCFAIALVNSISYIHYTVLVCISIFNVSLVPTATARKIKMVAQCIPLLKQATNPYINIAFDLVVKKQISKLFCRR